MLVKQLVSAATIAAFAVIEERPEARDRTYETLPIYAHMNTVAGVALVHYFRVPCYKCQSQNARLSMDFIVEGRNQPTFDRCEIYLNFNLRCSDLSVVVLVGNKNEEQMPGYTLAISPQLGYAERILEIIILNFRVIKVGGRFIGDVPIIDIRLLRAPNGGVLTGSVDALSNTESDPNKILCCIRQGLHKTLYKLFPYPGGTGRFNKVSKDDIETEGQVLYHEAYMYDGDQFNGSKRLETILFSAILPMLAGIAASIGIAILIVAVLGFIDLFRSWRKCHWGCRRFENTIADPANEAEQANYTGENGLGKRPMLGP